MRFLFNLFWDLNQRKSWFTTSESQTEYDGRQNGDERSCRVSETHPPQTVYAGGQPQPFDTFELFMV